MSAARIPTLDIVRGVAVLGILLLNIVDFAMPQAAYTNPRAYGGWHGADLAVWLVNFLLFDGKMRGLFSCLFGASMLLVIERAEAEGRSAARTHFARMLWLLAFGYLHLLLIWRGDILALYALVGMIAWACRRMEPERLLALGIALVLVSAFAAAATPYGIAEALADPGPRAAPALAEWNRYLGTPTPAAIAQELALYRGTYPAILADRLTDWDIPIRLLANAGAETLAYMCFGMAALRSGFASGEWVRGAYRRGLKLGFGIGLPLTAAMAAWLIAAQFALLPVAIVVLLLEALVRPLMIFGWACLILLLARPGGALTLRLAAAGRMAFTNYLATSVICTTLFYGYGLGWFGHLSRAQLYLVVPLVWTAILLWSKPWLARFRYGPLEWLWRSLARARLQPIRGAA
ncbi:DUF418 domain-containing protein [Sphingomonas sp.]|uniref:DUF418 domain-containing protein n=1 Tax=Sphingomonas sp. TaxID=28214 RepID=UPI001B100636|nr:DUF418 domain-containing protein [Sphingomonas sp.]MBO9711309.1 DUF418 domain-containing protein [Sphingomonas sp.]